MAEISAEGLEALANRYYSAATPGAVNYIPDYDAAYRAAAAETAQAQAAYIAALNSMGRDQSAAYNELRRRATGLDDVSASIGPTGDTATAEAMRANALNYRLSQIGQAEQAAEDARVLAGRLGAERARGLEGEMLAENARRGRATQQRENQAGAGREMDVYNGVTAARGYVDSARQGQENIDISRQQMELEKQQQEYNDAMTELSTFGRVMTKGAAEALGVPIGTAKALAGGKGRGGRGRGGAGNVKVVNFSSGFFDDGTPVRKDYKYSSEEDYADALAAAKATGNAEAVRARLQDGIYDGIISPKDAQADYNDYRERTEKSQSVGRKGRYRAGDY